MAATPRVHDEPAFVLHRHDWSESSLILDVFSRHHGRVALVAKGVKRPTSQFRAVLLPLQPLRLAWGGSGEVRTLKSAQWAGGHTMPVGEALLAGCYLNELLLRLLPRDDAHPALFDRYAQAVGALARADVSIPATLRAFELTLLRLTGYLPALDIEASTLEPLNPAASYQLLPDHGLSLARADATDGLPGQQWLRLQQALDSDEAFTRLAHWPPSDLEALRGPIREALHYHGGVRRFQTRQLMLDVQRLAASSLPPILTEP